MIDTSNRVLIVDDFELARVMLRECLTKIGFSAIDEAFDGVDGLEKIRASVESSFPYSVVFLDLNMPKMDGMELLATCRADPALGAIAFIIVSAEDEKDMIATALIQYGARDYVVKPFSVPTLQRKIEKVIRARHGQSK